METLFGTNPYQLEWWEENELNEEELLEEYQAGMENC